MYIEYNGQLYLLVKSRLYLDGKPAIITNYKEKADNTFSYVETLDYFYIKELKPDDPNIQNIFDVDYFVVYHDTSETVMKWADDLKKDMEKGDHINDDKLDAVFRNIWCANGGAPILDPPKIVNNEVEIILGAKSCSDDWIEFEWGWCYKAVNIYDCERLFVRYTYSVRDGRKLSEKEVVEVTMKPEEFKAEKLKYGGSNI